MMVSLLYQEDPLPFLYTILLLAVLGTLLARLRARPDFYSREGFAVVGLIWLALSLFGALLLVLRGVRLLHRLLF